MVSPLEYIAPEHLHCHDEFPYLKDVLADPRAKGFPAGIYCPFSMESSASRLGMLSKHGTQAVPIKGSEFPWLFTGFEQDVKQYCFDDSARRADGQVLAVIPKYNLSYRGTRTPFYKVLYKRETDGVIDVFTIERYRKLSDDWGYKNVWNSKLNDLVSEGGYLKKETVLSHTPNIKNGLYGIGRGAKVAYLSMPPVKEDGAIVSQSLADALTSWKVQEIIANVRYDYIPINLYGTIEEPKFFPNIGDKVRPDGIVCAFRPVSIERFAGDAAPEYLNEVDPSADITFIGPANGVVTDVDFIVNRQKRQQAYPQVRMYQDALAKYYKEILEVHDTWKKNHKFSPTADDLVTEAVTMLSGLGVDVPGIKLPASAAIKDSKHQTVDFIQIKITCAVELPFKAGSKLSDFQGGKATCAAVWADEDMPIDEYGNRADLVMEPNSPVKRTNYGALYEPAYNFILDLVLRRAKSEYEAGRPEKAFDLVVDVCRDFHPSYADLIEEVIHSKSLREEHVKDLIELGHIPLNVIPGLKTINTKNLDRIRQKWNAEPTPVRFNWPDGKGGKLRVVTTTPCMIGAKYIIRLCKEPVGMAAGIASVSHYGTPTRPHQSKKYGSLLRQTPVRWGEDETNIITMAVPTDEVLRLQRLTSKSLLGTEVMIESIIKSKKPTQIKRFPISNEELCRSDTIVGLFGHLNIAGGVDVVNTALTKKEVEERLAPLGFEIQPRSKRRKSNK